MDLRYYLMNHFDQLKSEGNNVIKITTSIERLFSLITNPNEFAGPIVEAWAHIQFESLFDVYEPSESGKQSFWDARIRFQNTDILLNIKGKEREKVSRSRINLSSFNRFSEHYGKPDCEPYYIGVFQYSWRVGLRELTIRIDGLLYFFDLLEIPKQNLKIEGASEGSFRIFISPIPPVAETNQELLITDKHTPKEFVEIITELRDTYLTRKASKRAKLSGR